MEKALGMFMVLIIALAMTGVAVSHWSDNVQVQGTVHMGDFIVGWLDIKDCSDSDDPFPGKDLAEVKCRLEDPETSVHHEPPVTIYHTLVVEVENAYPHYWAQCVVDIKNAGTIPAHIVEITVAGTGLVAVENKWDGNGRPIGWRLDNARSGKEVLNIELYKFLPLADLSVSVRPKMSLICNQIDPCQDEVVYLWLDIKQTAEECHTYEFTIDILAVQWNMAWEWGIDHYPPPPMRD